ncbi:MAG: toll/interleukin-1 receptor domain-containing protein, partial [Planctomycetes bacterium]|nr:toll/interleukin-1 receptor domain-containing protein [Planctomycetota bacterium]
HLAPLVRIGLIHEWYDHEILPGAEWEQEIADKLQEADIILLLISPDFAASKYCFEIELQAAMQRQEKKEAAVLPIIVRKTNAWQKLPAGDRQLGALNALPTSAKPIPSWNPRDDGWADVAAGVQRAAEALRKSMLF